MKPDDGSLLVAVDELGLPRAPEGDRRDVVRRDRLVVRVDLLRLGRTGERRDRRLLLAAPRVMNGQPQARSAIGEATARAAW